MLSEPAGKRIVFASLFAFMPTFLYLGLGAAVLPFALLICTAIFQLRQSVPLVLVSLGHVLVYSFVVYLISVLAVHLIYRSANIGLRLALLSFLVAAPILIACLPIFAFGGIRGGEKPEDAWHYYAHFYQTNRRQLHPVLGAFFTGAVVTLILARRSYDKPPPDA